MRFVAALCWAATLPIAACSTASHDSEESSVIVPLAPIPLQVTEASEFGASAPWTIRTASGELFLIDASQSRIAQFNPDGTQQRLIGRSGEGPGEFRALSGGAILPGDSLIVVADNNRGRVLTFGVTDGAFRREVEMIPPQVAGQHWAFDDSGALIPIALGVPVFLRWNTTTDSMWLWGDPTEFRKVSNLASIMSGEPSAIRTEGGWLAMLPGEGSLIRYDAAGSIVGTTPLPRRLRRGEPVDAREQVKKSMAERRFLVPGSMAMGIHALPDGRVLLIHLDVDGELNGRKVELTKMQWWATIYSPDMQQACVDQRMPFNTQELSRILFAGDTAMLVSRIMDKNDGVRSELQRVRIDPTTCEWQAVTGPTQ